MSFSDGFPGVGEAEIEAGIRNLPLHKGFGSTGHLTDFRRVFGKPFVAVTVVFFFKSRMAVSSETQNDGMNLLSKSGKEKSRYKYQGD